MRIGFLTNQLGLRGTETTLWGYAHYYEQFYTIKPFIVVRKDIFEQQQSPDIRNESIQWFQQRFQVILLPTDAINEWLLKNKISVCLVECGGYPEDYVPTSIPTIVHSVFNATIPMGTVHTTISNYLAGKGHPNVKVLPNILYLDDHSNNLRERLGIPKEARVFGRYGGYYQFDIPYVHEAILETAMEYSNIYFIFMNTAPFGNLQNVFFFEGTPDLNIKRAFINTCDAMIHARSDGETFGCAIGEFALCGKAIITSNFYDNAHLELLGSDAHLYKNKEELKNLFVNLNLIGGTNHSYSNYLPEKVIPILHSYVEEALRIWSCK
jgi:hypothetical protein